MARTWSYRRGRRSAICGPLRPLGGTLGDVVSLRIHVVDYRPEKAAAVGNALREFFSGDAKPASTWIGVAALADPGFLIEVEATAVLD